MSINTLLHPEAGAKAPSSTNSAWTKVQAALQVKGCGSPQGTSWRCPAHEDTKPSLSVSCEGGKVLLCCHAGCPTIAVLESLGLEWIDLFDSPSVQHPEATYNYHDANGTLLFQVLRYSGKHFAARRPDGNGGWVWNTKGVPRVLYNLPRVQKAIQAGKPIYAVEGEKDADKLNALGLVATCNPFGAGKWRSEHTHLLEGASEVRLIADRDAAGYKHAATIAASLKSSGIPFKVFEPAHGNDMSDLLGSGGTLTDLVEIDPAEKLAAVAGAQASDEGASTTSKAAAPPLQLVPLSELLAKKPETVEWLVAERLRIGGTSLLAAKPKTGKSTLARALALSTALGAPWLGLSVTQGPVFYVALEGREEDHIAHFRAMGAKGQPPLLFFHGISNIDLVDRLHAAALAHKPRLIIVDTMARLLLLKDSNAYAEASAAFDRVLAIAKDTGAHLLLIHHMRKTPGEDLDAVLGSTAIAASVDTILLLRREGTHRVLTSRQRVGPELEEGVVIGIGPDGATPVNRGNAGDLKLEEVRKLILDYCRGAGGWVTQEEIRENVSAKTALIRKALTKLVNHKQILRLGTGAKGSPYRYTGFDLKTSSSGEEIRVPWFPNPEQEPGTSIWKGEVG